MLNQYEQIRQMIFTPTQHLHHIERPIKDVVRSLHAHGHQPISLVWTDNVKADHTFAERVIPTLRTGLNSSSTANSSYPTIILPSDLIVHVASSPQLIDQACSSIMATIGDETTGKTISVGLSVEWDWRASQAGHFPAALMQIATKDIIYLLQVRITILFWGGNTNHSILTRLIKLSHLLSACIAEGTVVLKASRQSWFSYSGRTRPSRFAVGSETARRQGLWMG
jgi:hypothetical protein